VNGGVLRGRLRSQHVISGKWIVDFFFPEVRLAIEVDGNYHLEKDRALKDREKELDCTRFDITLVRVHNSEV
jgi:very-short-patch-repair endonuclease